jgi:hypothetical protein
LSGLGGGNYDGTVVLSADANNSYKKHLSSIRQQDILIELSLTETIDTALASWLNDFVSTSPSSRNGSIAYFDINKTVFRKVNFTDAQIKEVVIPELNGASNTAGKILIRITPMLTEQVAGDNTVINFPPRSKVWLNNAFQITLGNLPATRVSKVSSISLKRDITEDTSGRIRSLVISPLTISDIDIELSLADEQPWLEWYRSFLIQGNSLDTDELNGKITFFDQTFTTTFATIDISHVGIMAISDTAGAIDSVKKLTAKLYIESVTLLF